MQAYWPWAWQMIALVKLYRYGSDKKFMDGAIEIYEFMSSCHHHAFYSPGAGKSAWASSMLYAITGQEHYRRNTISQMAFILASQHPDGFMLQPGATCLEDQPIHITYNWTAEFGTWLVECAQELASRIQEQMAR
jgi:hypothetical protein